MNFDTIPVFKDPYAPLTRIKPDGSVEQLLYTIVQRPKSGSMLDWWEDRLAGRDRKLETEPVILVHPDRWDAFWLAIDQPDIFSHPEVRALVLGDVP